MSRDAVDAEITLEELELTPGGRATLRFRMTAREVVRIRGAHVSFAGFEETKAVYTTSDGKTTTTHTAIERNTLVEERKTFQGKAPAGFFHNLADGAKTLLGGGDHEELPRGSHDVVLEVELPASLPETFKAKKVRVAYEASIHLDIPAGRDFRQTVTFDAPAATIDEAPEPVPLSIRYPEDSARGFFDSMFGPDVSMVVDLAATVVDLHAEVLVTERLPQRENTSHSLFVTFEVRVPDDIISSRRGAKFTLLHQLAVSLDVPWAKDPTIRIPITIV